MQTCRICLHEFTRLRFSTDHIGICTRCANTLNNNPEPAKAAEARIGEMLARGMLRNAEGDIASPDAWRRQKAQRTLEDLDSAVDGALDDWITKLLANPSNSTRNFKIMRAHRRGLLRMDGFASRPGDWAEVAKRIRHRDGYKCMRCAATDTTLDVHHIVYLSNHGTNQQSNLITLCRKCHEAEHERAFDQQEAELEVEPIVAPPAKTRSSTPSPTNSNPEVLAPAPVINHPFSESQQRNTTVAPIVTTNAPRLEQQATPRASPLVLSTPACSLPRETLFKRLPPSIRTVLLAFGIVMTFTVIMRSIPSKQPSQHPAEAAEPREAIEEQLRAIMNDALRTHPYLATPEGLEDTRKMIIIRDRLIAEGMRPQDALRDAIGQVVGKTVK